MNDFHYMSQAIELAYKGLLTTSPNPRVGCVIVNDDQVVGKGFHIYAGGPHAEIHALHQAGEKAKGATAYVTLEPCSHQGKTGPCCQALINAGLARVVVAMQDPNPLVSGAGITAIKDAGISVSVGVLENDAIALNPGFIKRMKSAGPKITAKIATSLDGGTALANGQSKWITSTFARQDVMHLRARHCAIMTGINTILADDPMLNVRPGNWSYDLPYPHRQPDLIVLDSQLRIHKDAAIFKENRDFIIVTTQEAMKLNPSTVESLEQYNVQWLVLDKQLGGVDLNELALWLQNQSYNELWLEAGATLTTAFINAQLVDELIVYQASKLLGADQRNMLDMKIEDINLAKSLTLMETRKIGDDIRHRYKF